LKVSLRTQALLAIGLVEAVMLVVLLYSVFHFIEGSSRQEVERRALSIAEVFAATASDNVLSLDLASLQSFVQEIAETPGTAFARVVDSQGRLLAEAGDREALNQDFRHSAGAPDLPDLYMVRASIARGGEDYGAVEIGLDIVDQKQSIQAIKRRSIAIAAMEILLAGLISVAGGYYLTRRLVRVRGAIAQARSVNGFRKIQDNVPDELGELAREINRMNENFYWERSRQEQRIKNLEQLNRLLQRKLAEKREF
jgi:uncharacterized membrane protein affecting hemolysin expression